MSISLERVADTYLKWNRIVQIHVIIYTDATDEFAQKKGHEDDTWKTTIVSEYPVEWILMTNDINVMGRRKTNHPNCYTLQQIHPLYCASC